MASAMRKSKKVKASKSTSAVDIDKTDPAEFMFKAWVRGEAQSHLSAYVADKDPLHIIRAYQFLRMHKVAPDDTMLRNLDQAHKLIIGASMKDTGAAGIKPKSTPKPTPRNTKRNVDVLRHVHAAYGSIPRSMSKEFIDGVAKVCHTSEANVKMIVSRAREQSKGVRHRSLDEIFRHLGQPSKGVRRH